MLWKAKQGVNRQQATTGKGGVPSSGVTAVTLNATVTDPTAASYLTVWPAGADRPVASNLNFVSGETVPNLVTVKVGQGGKVGLFNADGSTHVIFDVAGYYMESPLDGNAGRMVGVDPKRILDTRNGTGGFSAKLGPGGRIDVQVSGQGGVPATGATGVVLNATATNATAPSHLTVWPNGAERPVASNLNFTAGQTAPNRVVAKIGDQGKVSLYNASGTVDVVFDVNGYVTGFASTIGSGGVLTALVPARILDTRNGTGGISTKAGPGRSVDVRLTGRGGIPATGVSAVVLNATATNPTESGYLTLWPTGTTQPGVSDVNFVAGQTRPNLALVKVGENGKVSVFNPSGTTDVVFDVVGWYS